MKIDILKADQLSPDIQNQVSDLFKQLGGNKTQVTLKDLMDEQNPIKLAYCEDDGKIIGIALMCCYSVISGQKGWIEDVVVHANYRGQGIGRQLISQLIDTGKQHNLSQILLFTEDHRTAAIRLYTDLGFQVKDSRIYTLKL